MAEVPTEQVESLPETEQTSLHQALTRARHAVRDLSPEHSALERNKGVHYFAFNPAQGLSTRFLNGKARFEGGGGWGAEIGLADGAVDGKATPVKVGNDRVEFVHGSDTTEWFVNRPDGIEHGFTLKRRDRYATADNPWLKIPVRLAGLRAVSDPSLEGNLQFVDASGESILGYRDLVVIDADGKRLPARMEPHPDGFVLAANDSGARYPITVDPLIVSLVQEVEGSIRGQGVVPLGFGTALALDGDSIAIGAPAEDAPGGSKAGTVYVFNRINGAWTQQTRLDHPAPPKGEVLSDPTGRFGHQLALAGDTLMISAADASSQSFYSKVYIYRRLGDAWNQESVLQYPFSAQDPSWYDAPFKFGWSLALQGDTAVIGCPADNGGINFNGVGIPGLVLIYTRSGGIWTMRVALRGATVVSVDGDDYGESVSLDGDTLAVGSAGAATGGGNTHGSVFVYTGAGAAWTQQLKLNGTGPFNFGRRVSVSGDTLAMGSGTDETGVDVYQRSNATWIKQATLPSCYSYGSPIALRGDRLLVGLSSSITSIYRPTPTNAPTDERYEEFPGGSVRSYTRVGVQWSLHQVFDAGSSKRADAFGTAIALNDTSALIGSPGDVSAHLFEKTSGGNWMKQERLSPAGWTSLERSRFGTSVGISGGFAVVGAPYETTASGETAGAAYVFKEQGDEWILDARLVAADASTGDLFGSAVSISGETLLVGTPKADTTGGLDAGAGYIFGRSSGTWQQQAKLLAANAGIRDGFGISACVSGDTVALGACFADGPAGIDSGKVAIFERAGTQWNQSAGLEAADGAPGDQFGRSVSIDGERLFAGAPYHRRPDGTPSGAAYAYSKSSGSWQLTRKLQTGEANERFGWSVSLSSARVLVGGPTYVPGEGDNSYGRAYTFAENGGNWTSDGVIEATFEFGANAFHFGFGVSVALLGDTAVIAMPEEKNVQVFKRTGSSWLLASKLGNLKSAAAVAISGDTVIAGFPNAGTGRQVTEGSAFIFKGASGTWSTKARLTVKEDPPLIGRAVCVWGNTAIIGADQDGNSAGFYSGSAYVLVRSGGLWTEQAKLQPSDANGDNQFGASVSLHGDTAVIGAPAGTLSGSGAAYIFVREGPSWLQQQKFSFNPLPGTGELVSVFGDTAVVSGQSFSQTQIIGRDRRQLWSIRQTLPSSQPRGLSLHGKSLLLANYTSADVFVESGTTWVKQAVISPSDHYANVGYIVSASLSDDTAYLGTSGSVYAFDRVGTSWLPKAQIKPGDGVTSSGFGYAVSASSGRLLVGSPWDNGAEWRTGSAQVVQRSGDQWSEKAKLIAPAGNSHEWFGSKVSLSGNTALVAATLMGPETQPNVSYASEGRWSEASSSVHVFRIASATDQDGDGLPDEWEISNNLNPADDGSTRRVNGAEGNPDGDRWGNLEEYLLGLNPRAADPDNRPAPLSVQQPAGTEVTEGGLRTFAPLKVGAESRLTFHLRNAGVSPRQQVRLEIDGVSESEFILAEPSQFALAGGETRTFEVIFRPTFAGAKTATLRILGSAGDPQPYVVQLTGTATVGVDPSFSPNIVGNVIATCTQADGKILIGGYLVSVAGTPRKLIARLNADGSHDFAFNPSLIVPPTSIYSSISCFGVQADGKILVGGDYMGTGSSPFTTLLRLNPDGTRDESFNALVNGRVRCLIIEHNGSILIGGDFTSINGVARNRLARLSANGAPVVDFAPVFNNWVTAIAVQDDGRILVAGEFTSVNGVTRNRMARLSPTGILNDGFNPDFGSSIYCMEARRDGSILVGGSFTQVGGIARNYLVRLKRDGALDQGFSHVLNGNVRTIASLTDGRIMAGGDFRFTTGTPLVSFPYVARLLENGSIDASFNSQWPGLDINRLSVQRDGRIIVGSRSLSGTLGVMRLTSDAVSDVFTVASPNRLSWLRGGASAITRHVRFDHSSDGGVTWNPLGIGRPIAGGWELTGITVPTSGSIRALARVENGSSGVLESRLPVPTSGLSGIEQWRMRYFGSSENSGAGANEQDFNGDQVSNLIKFATGQFPTRQGTNPGRISAEGNTIHFDYERSAEAKAAGIHFQVEWSDTLAPGSWTSEGVSESFLSEYDGIQKMRAIIDKGTNGSRFVRLKVIDTSALAGY